MFKSMLRSGGWFLLICALLAAGPAGAADLTERDAKAVRAVVEAQLQALAADDAVRAFSFASPAIRSQFGDAATFITMVRQGYPVLIRPAAIAFFQPEAVAGEVIQGVQVVQVVQLRDATGRHWLATYQLQRQADQRWRINGCAVAPDAGKSST